MSFTHLHLHSQYSLLDGAITVEGMLDRAKKTGMTSVALTDHGNLFGALDFYQQAIKKEIKPIIGIEGYITQGDRKDHSHQFPTNHIVLLAANDEGLKNLFRLVSLANFEGFYYKPRMDREILKKYSKGIIGLSACLNGVPAKHLLEHHEDKAEEAIREYRDIFGEENYYLELMETDVPGQDKVNKGLMELAKKLSIPLVGTNDCHYLNQEDAQAHDVLLCIGTGKAVHDQDRMKFHNNQFYMKTPEEMKALFASCPEAVSNTLEIAKKCNVNIDLKNYHMPKFSLPEGVTAEQYLEIEAKKGLEARMEQIKQFYGRKNQSLSEVRDHYHERLEKELGVINGTGFAGYFLIVSDFINYAKKNNIPVGPGRGSAAGSLVAFATNITDVDPIPYNLLFERFLNKERISLPDIDVDFCQDGRDQVIKYVSQKYGGGDCCPTEEVRVAQITTFGKMQARAAIRDVGRALGMAYGDVDRVAKLVPMLLNITLEEAFKQEPKFGEMRKKDEKIEELLTIAESLEGLTRHASVHAAGVVISDELPLVDHLPLAKGQHDEVVTQWDMKGVEKVGLVKFDFLGLKTLTLLARAVTLIEQSTGKKIDLLNIDESDQKVYELLSRGETMGIFQLESSGMKDLVMRLRPSSFEDIIALVALYRPGPLGSGMVDDFINCKHGRNKIVYELPQMEPILKDTYGVILYQEQVMQIASDLASYSLGEADLLRRAMGKKIPEEMAQQQNRFMDGCRKNKFPEAKAKKIFDLMEKFAGYGFNKSHSAAYAMISYQTAFLKTHYPIEFMAACLSIDRDNQDRVVLHLNDCRSQKIEVTPPNINRSLLDFHVSDGKIIFGLGAVKNVGENAIASILKARDEGGPFLDLFDFCQRVDLRTANKKVIESLIKCGAFDFSNVKRSQMFVAMEHAMNLATQTQKDRQTGQASLFGGGQVQSAIPKASYASIPEWEEMDRLQYEKESVGYYITGHPLLKYADTLKRFTNADTVRLGELKDKSTVRIGGTISKLKEITTKKGDRMAFANLEDLVGNVEMVVFSEPYRKAMDLLKSDLPIFVVGTVDIGEEKPKLIVNDIVGLEQASTLYKGSVHLVVGENTSVEQLENIKSILIRHHGEVPTVLRIQLANQSETVLSLAKAYHVSPTDLFIQDIQATDANVKIQLTSG